LGAGTLERDQLREAAAKSNGVLRQLGSDVQWVESYVAENKTFCVYLAKDEQIIRKHAELSGFPATKVTEVRRMIDPTPNGRAKPTFVAVGHRAGTSCPSRLLAPTVRTASRSRRAMGECWANMILLEHVAPKWPSSGGVSRCVARAVARFFASIGRSKASP
jgi:hypothetical protein